VSFVTELRIRLSFAKVRANSRSQPLQIKMHADAAFTKKIKENDEAKENFVNSKCYHGTSPSPLHTCALLVSFI